MMRPAIVATAVWVAARLCLGAPALVLEPFQYEEGFESGKVRIASWAKNGDVAEHVVGVTDERAFSGKRSLKLDVTFKSGTYHYWAVPVRVACAGKLKIAARILVGEGTTGHVAFGANMIYPPSRHSGCFPIKKLSGPTSGWELHEREMVEAGREGCEGVLRRYTTTLTADDVGVYVDRWVIFTYGSPGQRVVVYVDDVRIEGEVPSEEDYQAETQARFAKARKAYAAKVENWLREVRDAKAGLAELSRVPKSLERHVADLQDAASRTEKLVAELAKAGYASHQQVEQVENVISSARHAPETIRLIGNALAGGRRLAVAARRRPVANDRSAPAPIFARPLDPELRCSACRGEYESVSALVWALQDVTDLRVEASDLAAKSGDARIPAEAVDIRLLKWWYQGAGGIGYSPQKELKAELLLKDEGLVRVDQGQQENYLRSTAEDGSTTYLLCSGKTSEELKDVRPIDAKTLQPVAISADDSREFWITVHVPAETPSGTYVGRVTFTGSAGAAAHVPFTVTVHPFDLKPSRLIYSIYYRAKLSPDGRPTIGSEWRSEQQYRAELADLRAHGVLYPSNYQHWDERLLRRALEIRREAGLPAGPFYNLGQSTGNTADPAQLRSLQETVKKWVRLCRQFGYTDVYFYGIDEAREERLESQKMTWCAVQDAGGKTFVACYKKTFEAMGGLLNCAVLAHWPDPAEAEKWHRVGSHAFCYANPQVGVEEPSTYRRNFGLVLWEAGFDGAMDYAYQHAFGHVWNDFDSTRYRDHNFTYPTVDGVVGTIQWEGFREGVDDVRYVTTLEHAIQNASQAQADTARQAQQWLDSIQPKTADLDALRSATAQWITRLGE